MLFGSNTCPKSFSGKGIIRSANSKIRYLNLKSGTKKKNTASFKMKYLHPEEICLFSVRHISPYNKTTTLPDRDITSSGLLRIRSIFYASFYSYFILIIHFVSSIVKPI